MAHAALQLQLNDLYDTGHEGCTHHLPDLADDDTGLDELIAEMAREIYKAKGSEPSINKKVTLHYAQKLWEGVSSGYGADLPTVDFDTPDFEILTRLQRNTWQFSAAKNYQELRAMNNALLDETGKLRSFNAFKEAVKDIHGEHEQWLRAEYNMAVASGQMAATWTRIQESKDLLPLLQFDAVNDNRTTALCRTLDGVIRPVDDPFWDRYYPPNHWGCRSDVRKLASGKLTPVEQITPPDRMPEMFKTNLAKTGVVFPPGHPYWTGIPDDVKQQALRLMPYDAQFKIISKKGKGILRQHLLVDEKAKDYADVRSIAGEKVEQGHLVDIMPTISSEKDPLLKILFPDGKEGTSPDLRIDGDLWEVKSPQLPLTKNKIKHSVDAASSQANFVIVKLPEAFSYSELERLMKLKFADHADLSIVEFYYQGSFIQFKRP